MEEDRYGSGFTFLMKANGVRATCARK